MESAAIVGPTDVLLIESVADGPQRRRRRSGSGVDGCGIELSVGEEAWPRVVDHVEGVGYAVAGREVRTPWQRAEILHDRLDARLRLVAALGPAPVTYISIVGRTLGIRIG